MNSVSGLPGVVRLIDCFERHDSYIIVMERPEPCKDLFDYITEKGMLEEQLARNFFRQVVETIIACQLFDIFVPIADAAGVELTRASFRSAAEGLGEIDVTDIASASLGPGKFDLNDSVGVIGRFNPETAAFEPA